MKEGCVWERGLGSSLKFNLALRVLWSEDQFLILLFMVGGGMDPRQDEKLGVAGVGTRSGGRVSEGLGFIG